MSKREWTSRQKCSHSPCGEWSNYVFDSRRDRDEFEASHRTWRCVRHTNPDENLSADAPQRTAVLIARDLNIQGWLFWVPEGRERGGSQFSSGPGYKAFANDFPEGTRLVISARIELPAPTEAAP